MNKVLLIIMMVFFIATFAQPFCEAQMTEEEAQRLADDMVRTKKLKEQMNQVLAEEQLEKGGVLFEEGKYEAALSEFKKAEQLDPLNKNVEQYLQKVRKKIIEAQSARYSAGRALYRKGEFEAAIAELDKIKMPDQGSVDSFW